MDQSACINSTDFCTISDFIELLDCDYKCLALLERIRWPNGFVCPRCGANKGYRIPEYKLIQCAACRHQTSATSGTIFHRSRVAIRKWFAAILLLLTDKSGLPALRLHQTIGVSYKTALAMLKKLRSVMGLQNQLCAESPELTELQNLLKTETQQQIKGHFQFSKQSISEDIRPKITDSNKCSRQRG